MRFKSLSSGSLVLLIALWGAFNTNTAYASVIDFTGVNLASATSPSGQNFSFNIGSGSSVGNLNVKVISGVISSLQTGSSPDPRGLYVLSSGATSVPIVLRLSFDSDYNMIIDQNETLAQLEKNKFTTNSGAWSVNSSSNVTLVNSGSSVEFQGLFNSPPYGQYSIQGNGQTVDFQIENLAGFPSYGSAVSINVTGVTAAPEPSTALLYLMGICSIATLFRKRKTLQS